MTLAERMENSHPQKQLLARAERILKREIQDCQTASDIPRSIALYLNCVDALYGENAENHIFKDILDWNTFEDARARIAKLRLSSLAQRLHFSSAADSNTGRNVSKVA